LWVQSRTIGEKHSNGGTGNGKVSINIRFAADKDHPFLGLDGVIAAGKAPLQTIKPFTSFMCISLTPMVRPIVKD